MSRSLSLISFSSRLFPAHWALWIPHSSSSGNTGTLLNARGDALNGFEVIFERDYNLADAPVHRIIPLGDMREEHVTDAKENDGRQAEGTVAMNHVEEVALGVSAPGRRLRKMGGVEGPGTRVTIENCQTWVRDVVVALVEKGVMSEEAIRIVDGAPRN